jgi:hypothetical protein
VVSFSPRPLYPQGKIPWCPWNRRVGGPQSRSGRGGEEKNSQPLPGFETPIIQLVAQRFTTELSRLLIVVRSIMYLSTTLISVGISDNVPLSPFYIITHINLHTGVGVGGIGFSI